MLLTFIYKKSIMGILGEIGEKKRGFDRYSELEKISWDLIHRHLILYPLKTDGIKSDDSDIFQ